MYDHIIFKLNHSRIAYKRYWIKVKYEIIAYVVVINIDDHTLSKIVDAASSTFIISFSQAHSLLLLLL
jgi:hypothetical protein